QTADSGVQLALMKINANMIGDINTVFGRSCDPDGVIRGFSDAGAGTTYDLSFFNKTGAQITACATTPVRNISKIHSVGSYRNTVRAVDISVAPPCPATVTDYDGNSYTTNSTAKIEGQCWMLQNMQT